MAGHVVSGGQETAHVEPLDDPSLGLPGAAGIALHDCDVGAWVQWIVQDDRSEVENPEWSWHPGTIFLGADGALTQVEHTGGWSERIGVATGPHKLRFDHLQICRGSGRGCVSTAAASSHPQF